MNYLPLAAKSGAEIFCNIQAQYVKPVLVVDSDGVVNLLLFVAYTHDCQMSCTSSPPHGS
jgi:hypothetical protein